ncbi:hypothetical protein KR044_000201 [Drosophila immigrans]|nr:hypothetical protein KR044_000201 [Drosophila immigrans]
MKLDVNVDLNTTIYSGLLVNMEFLSRKHNSKAYQSFYECSLDMCHMMGSLKANIFKEWMSSLKKHGNFATKCPILRDYYYLRDFNTKELKLPSIFFVGSYRMSIRMLHTRNKSKNQELLIACDFQLDVK